MVEISHVDHVNVNGKETELLFLELRNSKYVWLTFGLWPLKHRLSKLLFWISFSLNRIFVSFNTFFMNSDERLPIFLWGQFASEVNHTIFSRGGQSSVCVFRFMKIIFSEYKGTEFNSVQFENRRQLFCLKNASVHYNCITILGFEAVKYWTILFVSIHLFLDESIISNTEHVSTFAITPPFQEVLEFRTR